MSLYILQHQNRGLRETRRNENGTVKLYYFTVKKNKIKMNKRASIFSTFSDSVSSISKQQKTVVIYINLTVMQCIFLGQTKIYVTLD